LCVGGGGGPGRAARHQKTASEQGQQHLLAPPLSSLLFLLHPPPAKPTRRTITIAARRRLRHRQTERQRPREHDAQGAERRPPRSGKRSRGSGRFDKTQLGKSSFARASRPPYALGDVHPRTPACSRASDPPAATSPGPGGDLEATDFRPARVALRSNARARRRRRRCSRKTTSLQKKQPAAHHHHPPRLLL